MMKNMSLRLPKNLFYLILISGLLYTVILLSGQIVKKNNIRIAPQYVIRAVCESSGSISSHIQMENATENKLLGGLAMLLGGDLSSTVMTAASSSGPLSYQVQAQLLLEQTPIEIPDEPQPAAPQAEPTPPPPEPPAITDLSLKTIPSSGGRVSLSGGLTLNNETQYAVEGFIPHIPFTADENTTVLILHSHTSESYTPSEQFQFSYTSNARTQDENYNMTRVGDLLTSELEALGINVVHNRTIHDYPNYNSSYQNAYETIMAEKKQTPNIQVVLDLHRDALYSADETPYGLVETIDGEAVAQVMSVIGTDELGLVHDGWRDNLSFAFYLQRHFLEISENFARPLNLRTSRFNGQTAPGAVIIEVGSSGNTLDQALAAAKHIARAVADTIHSFE